MSGRRQKTPTARETDGEGAAPRTRKGGSTSAEDRAEPKRGNESEDAHLIERRRDARTPEGL
ncbi:MAG: hypothetical protein WDN31_10615 [Hyphomicrobium sp.]